MSSASLRPLLRTSSHLPPPSPSYVCQQCRHARLLRRPKRPYTFTQLVTLSDGSAFTMRTTSPTPVYRSTRDTRNAPLWNPRSRELLNVEEDDAGRLAGFRARFGGGFDAQRDVEVEEVDAEKKAATVSVKAKAQRQEEGMEVSESTERQREVDMKVESTKKEKQRLQQQKQQSDQEEEDEGWDFGEEDDNMLDLISRFGQEESGIQNSPIVKKKQK